MISPELSRRIARALHDHNPSVGDRMRVAEACLRATSDADLPADVARILAMWGIRVSPRR